MSVAIGIDLGTTNTVVAAVIDGVAVTLEDEAGRRLLPSVVSFHPSGTVLVGDPARERRLMDPTSTIYSIKPLLGRSWDSDEVKAARGRFPFTLAQGTKNSTTVVARDVTYALPEISAFVLRRAKAVAEAALGQPVDRAVITVPANFNDLQRASTKIAGKLAGLDVMRILNEPTAAALAYGQSISKAEKIAVYDLGGGTFDITLLDLTGNVFEVLATAGDTALGGDDIDRLLADRIVHEAMKRFNVDPRTDAATIARLGFVAEEIKKELSSAHQAQREVTNLGYNAAGQSINMPFVVSRAELDAIALPLIDRTIGVATKSIEIIGLTPKEFDRVILVGGSTRMPLVARKVEELFGQAPHLKVNPDEVVALGAAIQAHALNRTKSAHKRKSVPDELGKAPAKEPAAAKPPPVPPAVPKAPALPKLDVPATPAYVSFQKAPAVISFSGVPGPPGAAPGAAPKAAPRPPPPPVPTAAKATSRSVPEPALPSDPPADARGAGIVAAPDLDLPDTDVHGASSPDQSVAGNDFFSGLELDTGPAITPEHFQQGSAINTAAAAPLLIDVTPLSLGVETVGGYSDVLIPANSPVPCEKTRTFLTASDGQSMVSIRVAQGESARFAENTRLGDLVLSELRSARRGEVRISVTFELDADGILNVRARDQDTGRETAATMRILGASTDAADVGAMAERQARHVVA
jgi:molecular chaperone DnaK